MTKNAIKVTSKFQLPTTFEIGQRYENERGAWVQLTVFQHLSNFYHVYGFRYWSPTFAEGTDVADSTTHMDRKRIERQMRNWLKHR